MEWAFDSPGVHAVWLRRAAFFHGSGEVPSVGRGRAGSADQRLWAAELVELSDVMTQSPAVKEHVALPLVPSFQGGMRRPLLAKAHHSDLALSLKCIPVPIAFAVRKGFTSWSCFLHPKWDS